jgi:LiaI-LiaF-like transmembrane region
MKTSHIFWGLLFIVLGGLVLINNFTTMFMDWSTIWKLWPLVVILLGLSILIKHKYGKGVVAGLAAIILAFAIFASFKTATHFVSNDFHIDLGDEADNKYGTSEYEESFDSTLNFATLNFEAGGGSFKIADTTNNLFYATTEGIQNNYSLTRNDEDSSSTINFKMGNKSVFRFGKDYKNKVDISLNSKPVWDMNFDVGAASMDFDLTPFKVKSVDVDMGAASITIKLNNLYPETEVIVDAGASDINILIPKGSGCKIVTDGALSSKHFSDFKKIDSDNYQTENFDEATNKVFINIECGVSSISVDRY